MAFTYLLTHRRSNSIRMPPTRCSCCSSATDRRWLAAANPYRLAWRVSKRRWA